MRYQQLGLLTFIVLNLVIVTSVRAESMVASSSEASNLGVSTTTSSSSTEALSNPAISIEQIPGTDIQIGDFVVGPGKIEVSVRPGDSVTTEISVTNRIDDNRSFAFTVEDMSGSASGEESVVLLGDQNGPYSLKDYITVATSTLALRLGERARVPVTITMPKDAEPGGYYGAVLVQTVRDKSNNDRALAQSPIVARIGTLFFITVPGEALKSGQLTNFSTIGNKHWFSSGPIDFGVTYENTGSVHQNPYGEIRITNMFGSEVGFVELDPWFVLPQSLRTREVTWNNEKLFGRYKVTANINRGYDDLVDTESIYLWVVPWPLLVTVFGVLFVIIFLMRWFFSKFEFKKK